MAALDPLTDAEQERAQARRALQPLDAGAVDTRTTPSPSAPSEDLVSGRILLDEQYSSIAKDIAISIMVDGVKNTTPLPQTQQTRGQVRLYGEDGQYNRFEIRKELLDALGLSSLVPLKGDAIEECIRFREGSRTTLYTPLYLQFVPRPGFELMNGLGLNNTLLGEVSEYALVSKTHEAAKIEMVVLMRRAAERAFNMNTTRRQTIYETAREISNNPSWTPADLKEAAPVARSLMDKARELVSMQSDQGKIWRNAKTVDAIRSGAMAIAASLNETILNI